MLGSRNALIEDITDAKSKPKKKATLTLPLDTRLNFAEHVKYNSEKADKKICALLKITPNIKGLKKAGNNQLFGLFNDSVRIPGMENRIQKKYANILTKIQKKCMLRTRNLIVARIENRKNLKAVKAYIKKIMTEKEQEERERQGI
ncbi:hypothetical protein JTB14_037135 [Gonioctena quinquepunctata]|nr:hypothetical protein JTB14_037135 [Gonioctena quinquepunctata]